MRFVRKFLRAYYHLLHLEYTRRKKNKKNGGTCTERDDLQGEEGLKSLAPPLQPKLLGLLSPYLGWEYFRGIELASP